MHVQDKTSIDPMFRARHVLYIYIYIHTHLHTSMSISLSVFLHIYIYTHTNVYIYISFDIHAFMEGLGESHRRLGDTRGQENVTDLWHCSSIASFILGIGLLEAMSDC